MWQQLENCERILSFVKIHSINRLNSVIVTVFYIYKIVQIYFQIFSLV